MALANRHDDIHCWHCGLIIKKAVYEKLPKNFYGHSNVIGWEPVNGGDSHTCAEREAYIAKIKNDPNWQKIQEIVAAQLAIGNKTIESVNEEIAAKEICSVDFNGVSIKAGDKVVCIFGTKLRHSVIEKVLTPGCVKIKGLSAMILGMNCIKSSTINSIVL
ncbi:MAG: hypothetical protein WC979_03355 [Candidatus Pacearchaeota archaeon]|jgi:hypothetical protein|nr:hypothetical protein [Clostridia bacterium]